MATRKKKQFRLPKKLGTCVDRLYKLRAERAELSNKVNAIKEEETAIKEHLIKELPKSDAQGILGKVARGAIIKKDVPTIRDFDKLTKHVLKTKDLSFFQRRLSGPACKERWEEGEVIPGVERFTHIDVSLTKIPSK